MEYTCEEHECSDGTKAMIVLWNYKDEVIDDFMENEIRFGDNPMEKRNFLWIEKFKEICGYKDGEELFFFTKHNCDGCFYVYQQEKKHFNYGFKIHQDGYAELFDIIPQYKHTDPTGIIMDSLYNDGVCDTLNS